MLQHLTVRDVISGAVGVAGGCCHCAADGGVTAMAGVSLLSTPRACACFHVHLYMLGASTSEVVSDPLLGSIVDIACTPGIWGNTICGNHFTHKCSCLTVVCFNDSVEYRWLCTDFFEFCSGALWRPIVPAGRRERYGN